ncbi:MAG: helix-turn-helix domain-containing protein [Deltaproteobacteria bacterium]|nr:helix-turn-helix domain-containing protein [Deltaproteobacteria bacterium]
MEEAHEVRGPSDRVTVPEAARLLRMHPKSLYRWLLAGVIPHRRLGTRYLLSRAAIAAWLSDCGAQR